MKDIIKLSWKNLMLNKNRTITTLVMIIITVATFAGISIMYESAIKGLEQTFKETKGDYHIAVKNVDKDYNKDLLKADNVKEVNEYYTISKGVSRKGIEKDITKEKGKEYLEKLSDEEREAEIQKVMSKLKKSKWYIQKYELNKNEGDYTKQQEETKKNEQIILNPYLGLDILGVNKEDLKGYNFRLIDGRFPENENEIMLQKSSKTSKYIFNLGTTLTMNGKEYKVVGYVNNVFDSNESKLDIGILKIASTEEKKEALNKIQSIYIKDIGKRVKATAEGISQTLKENPKNKDISMAVNKNLLRLQNANLQGYESSTDNVLSTLEMMRNVLIGIVAISGIIIMYNSFNLSLVERRKQYGILKSLGIKNSSLYIMILFEALVLSVVGIVIGYLCGMLGDYLVIGYINDTLVNVIKSMGVEKDLQIFLIYTTNIHAFYIVAISTTITVLLAAMIPAIKSTRISPIENIRGKDDYVVNTKKVKTSNISKKILGVEFDLARKNMKRAKKRFRVATLSLSIAFILLFVIGTLGTQINNQIGLLEVQTNAIFKNGNIVEMDHINITDKKDPKDKKYTESEDILKEQSLASLAIVNDLNEKVKVSDSDAKAAYDANVAKFQRAEDTVKLQLIVFRASDKAKADAALKEVMANPADFTSFVQKYNGNSGTGTGETQEIPMSQLAKSFEPISKAVQSVSNGQVVNSVIPVGTNELYIVKVLQKNPKGQIPFETVKEDIKTQIRTQKRQMEQQTFMKSVADEFKLTNIADKIKDVK